MKSAFWLTAGLAIMFGTPAASGDGGRPLREVRSDGGRFELRIDAGRAGRVGRNCRATLYERSKTRGYGRRRSGRRVWERALVNDMAPGQAYVRDDGRYVVTLDEYRRGGARHALVVYGAHGELLRHYLLHDLLGADDWSHVTVSRRELKWLKDARCAFVEGQDEFVIELKWGRVVRLDLNTLQLVGMDGQLAGGLAAMPADVLAQLLGHLEDDGERVIAARLAELTPEQQSQADAVAEELTSELPSVEEASGEDVAAAETEELEEPGEVIVIEDAAAEEPPEDEPVDAEVADNKPVVAEVVEDEPDVAEDGEAVSEVANEVVESAAVLAGIAVPMPDPVNPVDYVAWLNGLGKVEGPDANPVYEAAIEEVFPWEGERDLLVAAARGNPAALGSPEIAAWLDANAEAMATFSEASRYQSKGWDRHSEDGSMIGVLLPSLGPLRNLGRASVIDGRRLLEQGDAEGAVNRYLDTLAAGAHTGGGVTLIENLVGVAMQGVAAEALLDLQADEHADRLDYANLAAEVEAAYGPIRPLAETVQGERAMYLDAMQRIWSVDPDSGEYRMDVHEVNRIFEMAGDEMSDVEMAELFHEVAEVGYEDAVAQGNAYYDTLTEALSMPYQEGRRWLEELDTEIGSAEGMHPLLRTLAPSLTRCHFLRTRAETTRRATLLVSKLRAWEQQYGEYPDSLDVFADQECAYDPFNERYFAYHRGNGEFQLYSVGGDGADDAGVHDRKGDVNDLLFWPRPE